MKQGRNLGGSNFSKTDPKHKDYWATPQWSVDGLFAFVEQEHLVPRNLERLDVCASELNAKCPYYIDEETNTLMTPWGVNQLCWMNPPYSNVQPFLQKAVEEAESGNYTVALLKNDCSTKWFNYAIENATAVIFITLGRIGFVSAVTGESVGGSNFSSVAFLFGPMNGVNRIKTYYVSKNQLEELGNA